MANPAIGHIKCPITNERAEVCRAKSGRFPMYYRGSAGIIHGKTEAFQNWLLDNANISGAGGQEVKQDPEPKHKKGFLASFLEDDDE